MARKRVNVLSETDTGRNILFHDNYNNKQMTRAQFVKEIEHRSYENYHIREIDGIKTPVSNPDKSEKNNLE